MRSANSPVMTLYLPISTLKTAWVPTICDDGVTSGGWPESAFTSGTSAITSLIRSPAP